MTCAGKLLETGNRSVSRTTRSQAPRCRAVVSCDGPKRRMGMVQIFRSPERHRLSYPPSVGAISCCAPKKIYPIITTSSIFAPSHPWQWGHGISSWRLEKPSNAELRRVLIPWHLYDHDRLLSTNVVSRPQPALVKLTPQLVTASSPHDTVRNNRLVDNGTTSRFRTRLCAPFLEIQL